MSSKTEMKAWEQKLRTVLDGFYKSEATTECVVSMYRSIRTTAAILRGDDDPNTRMAVLQMLVDLTYGLATNPFYQHHTVGMQTLFYTAVNSHIDSLTYMDEEDNLVNKDDINQVLDLRMLASGARNAVYELAIGALMFDSGGSAFRAKSRELRDALNKIQTDEMDKV